MLYGPAEIREGRLETLSLGKVMLSVKAAGNDDFEPLHQKISLNIERSERQILEPAINDCSWNSIPPKLPFGPDVYVKVSGPAFWDDDQIVFASAVGKVEIKAFFAQTANFKAQEKKWNFRLFPAEQQLEFDPKINKTSDFPIALSARSNSGLPIDYEVIKGPLKIKNDSLFLSRIPETSGSFRLVLAARQSGNKLYFPTEKQAVLRIENLPAVSLRAEKPAEKKNTKPAAPVLSFLRTALPEKSLEPFCVGILNINRPDSVNGKFELADTEGLFEIREKKYVYFTGKKKIKARKNADLALKIRFTETGGKPIESVFDLEIRKSKRKKAFQFIRLKTIPDRVFSEEAFVLEAETDSPNKIIFEVIDGPAKILADGKLKLVAAGKVRLRASLPATSAYHFAENFTEFYVKKAKQVLQIQNFEEFLAVGFPMRPEGSSSAGLPLRFELSEGNARLENGELTLLKRKGVISLKAFAAGDERYEPAETERSYEFPKKRQRIKFGMLSPAVLGGDPVPIDAYATSGLPLRYEIAEGEGRIEHGMLLSSAPGKVVIRAVQEGDEDFAPAESVERQVVVRTFLEVCAGPSRLQKGQILIFPFSTPGTFPDGNTFRLVLSGPFGDFEKATVLGKISGEKREFQVKIPENIPLGSRYCFRVESTAPEMHSLPTSAKTVVANDRADAFAEDDGMIVSEVRSPLLRAGNERLSVGPENKESLRIILTDSPIESLHLLLTDPEGHIILQKFYENLDGFNRLLAANMEKTGKYSVKIYTEKDTYSRSFTVK